MRFVLEPVSDAGAARFGQLQFGLAGSKPIDTPALLTLTHRGVVPHLSSDHLTHSNSSIRWIHVPFESFLEQTPPIPKLQPGPRPLHKLLGFNTDEANHNHIVSMSLRDPTDLLRPMPPNGNTHVAAMSLRGVRKVSVKDWSEYARACAPDVVVALTDTPGPPTATAVKRRVKVDTGMEMEAEMEVEKTAWTTGISQKRLTKSIERSTAWIGNLLAAFSSQPSLLAPTSTSDEDKPTVPLTPARAPDIFVHLAGMASQPARKAFASSLLEPLSQSESIAVGGLECLDQGISGYTVDLEPLRWALDGSISTSATTPTPTPTPTLPTLLAISLSFLPATKPRLVTGTRGPHEILELVKDVGVDVVDAVWAIDAASWGVALDFMFPVPFGSDVDGVRQGGREGEGKKELGHNLYDTRYRLDFGSFSNGEERCPCAACSPVVVRDWSAASSEKKNQPQQPQAEERKRPNYTRAYLHHLLHTHEMSAHALLTMHNLQVVRSFLQGVREVVRRGAGGTTDGVSRSAIVEDVPSPSSAPGTSSSTRGKGSLEEEIERFFDVYSSAGEIFEKARGMWKAVDMERGKGRLRRERERAGEGEEGGGERVKEGEVGVS